MYSQKEVLSILKQKAQKFTNDNACLTVLCYLVNNVLKRGQLYFYASRAKHFSDMIGAPSQLGNGSYSL